MCKVDWIVKHVIFSISGIIKCLLLTSPISVVVRSKTWVCDRSLAGIAGSNTAGGMDVYRL